MLVLPIAPFSPKLHRGLTFLALIVFIVTTAYLWIVFPFTSADPLKVFFQQTISLDPEYVSFKGLANSTYSSSMSLQDSKVMTELTGTPAYLEAIIPYLPSSRSKRINCTSAESRPGLSTCRWSSGKLVPSPGGRDLWNLPGDDVAWLKADVTRSGWASATIIVQGRNTRNCRLYFDPPKISGVKVVRYAVQGGSKGMQPGYHVDPKNGVQEVRLWSRTWNRVWEVDVDWETPVGGEDEGQLSGRIACEWAEYQSGMIDNGSVKDGEQAKIPALEEALTFLPEWAVVSKGGDGLVEASVPFTL